MTVYYLRADNGAIKIGYSTNADKRFSSISTASPLGLELVAQEQGGLKLERQRHERFRGDSIRGEWFYPSDGLNEHIAKLNLEYRPMPYVDRESVEVMRQRVNEQDKARIGNQLLIYDMSLLFVFFGIGAMALMAYALENNKPELMIIAMVLTLVSAVAGGAFMIYDRMKRG